MILLNLFYYINYIFKHMQINFNNLIRNISISVNDAINEHIGTLQDDIDISQIIDDIRNHKYLESPVKYELYKNIEQLQNTDTIYTLLYDNLIPWIEHLEIIICINDNSVIEAAALLENNSRTIYTENSVLLATIVVNNPDNIRFLETQIVHEIRHYYDDFKRSLSVYKSEDRDLNFYLSKHPQEKYIDFNKFKDIIMTNINYPTSLPFVKKMFISQLYWLNNKEIYAHNENMFGEIKHYYMLGGTSDKLDEISETYNIYKNLKDIFVNYKNNLDEKSSQYILKYCGKDLYNIYFNKIGKPTKLDFAYKKIIHKCNIFFKHAEQMKNYCKLQYGK